MRLRKLGFIIRILFDLFMISNPGAQGRRKQREVGGALHYKGTFFIKKGHFSHCFILRKGHFGEKLGGHMPPMPPRFLRLCWCFQICFGKHEQ